MSVSSRVVGFVSVWLLLVACARHSPRQREAPKNCPSAIASSSSDAATTASDSAVVSRSEAKASLRTDGALDVSAGETYLLRAGGAYAALTFTEAYTGKDADGFDITGMKYQCRFVNDPSGTLACATVATDVVYERDFTLAMEFGCGKTSKRWTSGGKLDARCGALRVMWSAPKYLYFKDFENRMSVEIALDKGDRLDPFDPTLKWERGS